MKKIARFVPVPIVGGVGVSVLAYFRLLDHARYQTDFFVQTALPDGVTREIEAAGGRVVVLPSFAHPLSYLVRAVRELKKGGYEIVHSHMNTLSAFPLFAAFLARIPVRIAQAHATSSWREPARHLSKLVLRPFAKLFATRYAACSENAGRWQFGDRAFRAGRITIIHTAIDLKRFAFDAAKRTALRARLGFDEEDRVIGHVGRMCTVKNQLRLVSIFGEVAKRLPAARLLLVGGGPLLDDVRAKVAADGLTDRVVFTGETNGASDYYNAMDLFVFPSLYEGLGRSLIEAQTNGLKSFASDRVPAEAKVTGLVDFLLLDANDVTWSDALVAALDKGRAHVDSAACVADAGYDINQEVYKHEELYQC